MEQETMKLNQLRKQLDDQISSFRRESERMADEIQEKNIRIQALKAERENAKELLEQEAANKQRNQEELAQMAFELKSIQFENEQYVLRKVINLRGSTVSQQIL